MSASGEQGAEQALSPTRRVLNSWKEIASFLHCGIRTVQRWEKRAGLPVHRPLGERHGNSVLAFTDELERWIESQPSQFVEAEVAADPEWQNTSGSHRILAVDDNEVNRYVLARTLSGAGFEALTAQCGREAIQLLRTHRPDLVLLDIHMPDMSGFDVCAFIRSHESFRTIPVIFHSATSRDSRAQYVARAMGADAFFSYPFEPESLLDAIRAALSKRLLAMGEQNGDQAGG